MSRRIEWRRLQDGARLIGDLWPASDDRQRREILLTALWSHKVSMRARFAPKPRRADGQPVYRALERVGAIGRLTPVLNIESALICTDPRKLHWDIPASRITITADDTDKRWESLFPNGTAIATGQWLSIELSAIEFDAAAARAYITENLLPIEATPIGDTLDLIQSELPSGVQPGIVRSPIPNPNGKQQRPVKQGSLAQKERDFVAFMKAEHKEYGRYPPRDRSTKSDGIRPYSVWAREHGVPRTRVEEWAIAHDLTEPRGAPKTKFGKK